MMKPRYLLIAMLCLALAVFCAALYQMRQEFPIPGVSTVASQSASSSTASTTISAAASYTLAEVATHDSASSCWSAINGSVYDLTNWIYQHPGGPEHILAICGTDGSAAFNAQHGGEAQPAQELKQFYIGTLSS